MFPPAPFPHCPPRPNGLQHAIDKCRGLVVGWGGVVDGSWIGRGLVVNWSWIGRGLGGGRGLVVDWSWTGREKVVTASP